MSSPRQHILLLPYWIIVIATFFISWKFLPTVASQFAVGFILSLGLIASLFMQFELLFLLCVSSLIILANIALVNWPQLQIVWLSAFLAAVYICGLLRDVIRAQLGDIPTYLRWFVVAVLTTELLTMVNYWPVSFFDRTLMTLTVFFGLWKAFEVDSERRSLRAHFVFVVLAVILVVGSIIWSNFPYLINF